MTSTYESPGQASAVDCAVQFRLAGFHTVFTSMPGMAWTRSATCWNALTKAAIVVGLSPMYHGTKPPFISGPIRA